MYSGRMSLGERVPIALQVVNASGVPTDPDDAPLVEIYDSTGTLQSSHRLEPLGKTGLFGYSVFLGVGHEIGWHCYRITWAVSSSNRARLGVFHTTQGGQVKGPVVALTSYDRPHASYLVSETEEGYIEFYKNPQLKELQEA